MNTYFKGDPMEKARPWKSHCWRPSLLPGAVLALLGAIGCSGPDSSEGPLEGRASFMLAGVTPEVGCVQITVTGAARVAMKTVDVAAGASSVNMMLSGLPLGRDTFVGEAFSGQCAVLTSASAPIYVSDPRDASVVLGTVANVEMTLKRNGQANIVATISDEPACSAAGISCLDSKECCHGSCIGGVCAAACVPTAPIAGTICDVPAPTFLWLDASDSSSLTKDDIGNVSQWRDKSGLGRDANVLADTAPVWSDAATPSGLPAIAFNGGSVRMQTASVPTSSEMTMFVVFKMDTPQSWGAIINQAHDAFFSLRKSDCCGGGGNLNFHIQNDNAAPLQPIVLNSWKLVTAIREGNTSTIYYSDGVPDTFAGDTLDGGVTVPIAIGNSAIGNQSMGGYIAEIRAYSSALSAQLRGSIESVLRTKYGI